MQQTDKKRILVTGASGGIGAACARKLASDGFALALHCRKNREKADRLAEELRALGTPVTVVCFDAANTEETRRELLRDIEDNGAYWGVVHSSGITRDVAFPAMSTEDWFSVIDVDLNSFYNVVQCAVMPMISLRNGGRVIAISSVSGITGNRGQVNYSAAKAGLIGACKALSVELAKRKITVNAVAPGLIETDMAEIPEEAKAMILASIPMKRMGKPEEVASVVSFLASDGASYVTRQVISVNGGIA